MDNNVDGVDVLELPAFELDCRDWLVATPADGTVPEEIGGAPVVAVLSTMVVRSDVLETASAVLSVGLLDEPVESSPSAADSPALELIDGDVIAGSVRYVVPAPGGQLALLAEFTSGAVCQPELTLRFHQLMTSFKWAC